MPRTKLLALITAALMLPACAGGPASSLERPGTAASASAPTRLVAAIRSAPPTMVSYYNTITPGSAYMGRLVMSGLTVEDDQGTRLPHIAENVPTTDNGLWKVLPDGTMETTWIIRRGAAWHDSTPFTPADLVFTGKVQQDPELRVFLTAQRLFYHAAEQDFSTDGEIERHVNQQRSLQQGDGAAGDRKSVV